MQIKDSQKFGEDFRNRAKEILLRIFRTKLRIFFIAGFLLVILLGASFSYSVYLGGYLYRTRQLQKYNFLVRGFVEQTYKVPYNYIKGMMSNPEKLVFDIKFEDYQKIAYFRQLAVRNEKITPELKEDYIPADLTHNNKTYRVKLRLAGTVVDHIITEKWSFKINIRGDETLFGMKEFTIMHPTARMFLSEWICHKFEMNEGLVSLKRDFVDVTINGDNKGVYIIEERFDKRLIEHNRFREGILFRPRTPLHILQASQYAEDPEKTKNLDLLKRLYAAFRNGEIPPDKLFDYDKMARFLAIVDLTNGYHMLLHFNAIFYFNPITGLVEPIGREWDSHPYHEKFTITGEKNHKDYPFFSDAVLGLLEDPLFFTLYLKHLQRISNPEYLNEFFINIKSEFEEKLQILHKDYPSYDFNPEYLYQSQVFISNKLNPQRSILRPYLYNNTENSIRLALRNSHSLPVRILQAETDSTIFFPENNRLILSSANSQKDYYQYVDFPLPAEFTWDKENAMNLTVSYKIPGGNDTKTETVYPWPDDNSPEDYYDLVREDPNYEEFDFIKTDEKNRIISIKQGSWTLARNLIIPKGYTFTCEEGTKIDLSNSATILSYSPVDFSGGEDSPIIIGSEDSTGDGFFVMSGGKRSVLNYVYFDNLSNPNQAGWQLTGAVNFYESPVSIYNCRFLNNRCEDGLNIIRSDFKIDNTLFSGTLSDAFDADFCTGEITNSVFTNTGNDGIDVSGSEILLKDIFIDNAGDKGISGGEESTVTAENITVKNSNIVLASKDMSIIKISTVMISGCEIGFLCFQKKSEFGPSTITITGLNENQIKTLYMIEERSRLNLDGNRIRPNSTNLKDLFY